VDRFRPEEESQLVLKCFNFSMLPIGQLGLGDFFNHCLDMPLVCQLKEKILNTVPYYLRKEAVR
jgi:hypothetical protein